DGFSLVPEAVVDDSAGGHAVDHRCARGLRICHGHRALYLSADLATAERARAVPDPGVKTQVGESTSSAPPSNVWRAKRSYGGLIGVGATAGLLVLGVACSLAAVRQPPGPAALYLFLLAAFTVGGGAGFGAAALSYFRLGYEFRPGRLLIHWAGG